MKAFVIALAVIALVIAAVFVHAASEPAATEAAPALQKAPKLKLESAQDKFSYSMGINVGRSLRKEGLELATQPFLKGISDGLTNAAPLMTEQEMGQSLQHLREMMTARQQKMSGGAGDALKKGQAFLADNGKKEGVVTLPDGLQYKVLTPGSGASPGPDDVVTVHYSGTLTNGTEFDSSYQRGQPAQFKVGQVIEGWQEALKLMKKGAKWQLFIPSDLAYGKAGRPPVIGPNEVLIFTVELLDIQKQ